jgi:hypothetical protein
MLAFDFPFDNHSQTNVFPGCSKPSRCHRRTSNAKHSSSFLRLSERDQVPLPMPPMARPHSTHDTQNVPSVGGVEILRLDAEVVCGDELGARPLQAVAVSYG